MPDAFCRLDSDWDPDARRLTLTLVNRGEAARSGFRLAFTSLLRIKGAVAGGRLVEQLSNNHVIAPPDGFVLPPGGAWTVTADGVSHDLRHYTYGPKTAWLECADGTAEAVTPTPMARGGVATEPDCARPPTGLLPAGAPPLSVVPHPARIAVEGARPLPAALVFAGGPAISRAAFDGAAGLAARLMPGLPLFGPGGVPCRAEIDSGLGPEAYRLDFEAAGVRLAAAGAAGFTYGWITLAQVLHGARTQPATFVFPAGGRIEDAPRFGFRGAHLDVAR
ncbi:MAG: beta-hexosaminidase, partial [Rhizobiales bacterium]|nr:beta-hexosaminidase [Hyphomicrobiales bacterium]